jgi:hypothetical protein
MVEERLTITLPEGFRWLTGKIVAAPSREANVCLSGNSKMVFDLGLFRCREHIRFEALAEVPSQAASGDTGKGLEKALNFNHRIEDTRKVDQKEIPTESESIQDFLAMFVTLLILGFSGLAVYFYPSETKYTQIIYSLKLNDRIIDVQISPQTDGTVKITGVNENFTETIPLKVFFHEHQWEPKIQEWRPQIIPRSIWDYYLRFSSFFSLFARLILIIFFIIVFLAMIIHIRQTWETNRLKKLLAFK